MASRFRALLVVGLGLVLMGAPCSNQRADPNYHPVIENPSYPLGGGPRVAVDGTHDNMHRVDGSYRGFAKLLEADGYVVEEFSTVYTEHCEDQLEICPYWLALGSIDVLVIANAREEISRKEAQLLADWVEAGGSLFLIADHAPFPYNARKVADAFGVDWSNNQRFGFPFFTKADGTLANHPVSEGFDASEEILEVRTFTGSVFEPEKRVGSSLFTSILAVPEGTVDSEGDPVGGLSMGTVVEFGGGRVYLSGEAAMFTAKRSGGAPSGMQVTPYNEQFLLNILHWLDGLLQDSDPDYDPVLENPTYPPGGGPSVAVDGTHLNLHRIDGSYEGFAKLLEADGYLVEEFGTAHTNNCKSDLENCPYWLALSSVDVLVIANAREEIDDKEADLLADWVEAGGSLFLIADAEPFLSNARRVAEEFDVDWEDNRALSFPIFSKPAGSLANHPVTEGFDASDEIPAVVTFNGSVFELEDGDETVLASILTVPEGAVDSEGDPVGGLPMGTVVEFGSGRVYLSGDAAMFTAKRSGGAPSGMQVTPYNEQFLLNILHWLDGLL